MKLQNHIILLGMMGCGKTTIGKAFSIKHETPFIDLDQYLENKFHDKISTIIHKTGIEGFRIIEEFTFNEIIGNLKKPSIISLGGGTFSLRSNLNSLKKYDTIFLDCDILTIMKRIVDDNINDRPLVKGLEKEKLLQTISNLLLERTKLYNLAKYKIDSSSNSIDNILLEIERLIIT